MPEPEVRNSSSGYTCAQNLGVSADFLATLPRNKATNFIRNIGRIQLKAHHPDSGGLSERFQELRAIEEQSRQFDWDAVVVGRSNTAIEQRIVQTSERLNAIRADRQAMMLRGLALQELLLGIELGSAAPARCNIRVRLLRSLSLDAKEIMSMRDTCSCGNTLSSFIKSTRAKTATVWQERVFEFDAAGRLSIFEFGEEKTNPALLLLGVKPGSIDSDTQIRLCRTVLRYDETPGDDVREAADQQPFVNSSRGRFLKCDFSQFEQKFDDLQQCRGKHLFSIRFNAKGVPFLVDEGKIVALSGFDARESPTQEELLAIACTLSFRDDILQHLKRPHALGIGRVQIAKLLEESGKNMLSDSQPTISLTTDDEMRAAFEEALKVQLLSTKGFHARSQELCALFGAQYTDWPELCADALVSKLLQSQEPDLDQLDMLLAAISSNCAFVFKTERVQQAFFKFLDKWIYSPMILPRIETVADIIQVERTNLDNWLKGRIRELQVNEVGLYRAHILVGLFSDKDSIRNDKALRSSLLALVQHGIAQIFSITAQRTEIETLYKLIAVNDKEIYLSLERGLEQILSSFNDIAFANLKPVVNELAYQAIVAKMTEFLDDLPSFGKRAAVLRALEAHCGTLSSLGCVKGVMTLAKALGREAETRQALTKRVKQTLQDQITRVEKLFLSEVLEELPELRRLRQAHRGDSE